MAWSVKGKYGPNAFILLSKPVAALSGDWSVKGDIWPEDGEKSLKLSCTGKAHLKLTGGGRFIHLEYETTCVGETWAGGMIFGYSARPANDAGELEMHSSFYNRYGSFGTFRAMHKKNGSRIEFKGDSECFDRGSEPIRCVLDIRSPKQFTMEIFITTKKFGEEKARHLTFSRS